MSCNRSAGTGGNQIIWCGWAAAAGARCGRAAGFPGPDSGAAASASPAPPEPRSASPAAPGRALKAGGSPRCRQTPLPGRNLPARRGPTGSAALPAKHGRAAGRDRADRSQVVHEKVFPSFLVSVSGHSRLLSRGGGWQRQSAPPGIAAAGPVPHPPARTGSTCRSRGLPAEGFQTASSYLSPFLASQTCVGGRLRLGKAPRGAGVVCGSMGIWPLVPAAAGRGLCFLYKKRHN